MTTDRPNTVSGLIAKRDELLALRRKLEAEARKITCDIDHLEACIRLFDPENTPEAVKRYSVQHRAQKGHLKRFVLGLLRDAEGSLSSRQITEAWIADRGLRADDATFVILRKRIGACLIAMRADGLAEDVGHDGEYKVWRLGHGP